MANNPLLKLESYGQSIWLDFLRRALITSGKLKEYIEKDGLSGQTSNPKIFDKAIAGSHDYDEDIESLAQEGKSVPEIYEVLTVKDVQMAADVFRPVFDRTKGGDGFVSLEVSPHLAHDAEESVKEARRLFGELDRPNVFIKIPGTEEGLEAIRRSISEGINVNVTLLFGLRRYRKVAEAYMAGLEDRLAQGKPIDSVSSVASFFLSRIDVLVDPMLEKKMEGKGEDADLARQLHGQVAVASAKVAYEMYKEIFSSERFKKLAEKGAQTQRVLWASTSTKNPSYSDVKYVEALIGPKTINTVPVETLDAYRDHGDPAPRLEDDVDKAHWVMDQLPKLGIDIDDVTQQLEDEGVEKFNQPYDQLMETLKEKREEALQGAFDRQALDIGGYEDALRSQIEKLKEQDFVDRLWRKDASLWKDDPKDQKIIRNALGWLHVAEKMEENLSDMMDFVKDVQAAGFERVVHMGMGGSSLAPLVFERTFFTGSGALPLMVLDTTDPATILRIERMMPVEKTLFIVASKSGTTAEPLAFLDYFYAKVHAQKGDKAGENFIAITDPGTPLVDLAREKGFRKVFLNFPDIGGRYSALSYFGMLPAALMGVNVAQLLDRTQKMAYACTSSVPMDEAPGVVLGALMGAVFGDGRDKVTFLMPDSLSTLGMWLEQLLAESTGKEGTGLLPVAGEPVGEPAMYADDRLFAYVRMKDDVDEPLENAVAILRDAGKPMVTVFVDDLLEIGQEFFRWEIATATAGSILGINAFNQPNVQESKDNTDRLLKLVEEQGALPEDRPDLVDGVLGIFGDQVGENLNETLKTFFAGHEKGDYAALMAYLTEDPDVEDKLQAIRLHIRNHLRIATTLGYGPRFLHSTGQYHKGGPNNGFFIQLTAAEPEDAPIPGRRYSFGVLKAAQAEGDLQALRKHDRRVIRIHLGSDVMQGLEQLEQAIKAAL